MNTVLVVDDEQPARKELRFLIENAGGMGDIFEAKSGHEALTLFQTCNIDIAFIDISLGDMDGIALAREARKLDSRLKIIFATAYNAYAVKAFELEAIDYIMKPFEQQRVEIALKRAQSQYQSVTADPQLNPKTDISPNLSQMAEHLKKFSLWKGDRVILIDIEDVVFMATAERNCRICTVNDEFVSHQSLGYFQQKFQNNNFYRANRSYLVNLNHILEIQPWFNNAYLLKMKHYESEEIIISRNTIKEFRMLLDF